MESVNRRSAFVCDLDGTICNLEHRLHFLHQDCPKCGGRTPGCSNCGGRDMDGFHDHQLLDTPHPEAVAVVQALMAAGHRVVFLTCRPNRYRGETVRWIKENILVGTGLQTCDLIMREDGDHRKDPVVKAEMYRGCIEPRLDVFLWIEDRTSVVDMVREELGIPCWQVRPGDF